MRTVTMASTSTYCPACTEGRASFGPLKYYLLRLVVVLASLNILMMFSYTSYTYMDNHHRFQVSDLDLDQTFRDHAPAVLVPAEQLGLEPPWNKTADQSQLVFKYMDSDTDQDGQEGQGQYLLSEDSQPYLLSTQQLLMCLYEGTDVTETYSALGRNEMQCHCARGWRGSHCSIPDEITKSSDLVAQNLNITVRRRPRRLIMASLYNNNTKLWINGLHKQFVAVGDVAHAFLILWPWGPPNVSKTDGRNRTRSMDRSIFMQELWMTLRSTNQYRKIDFKVVHAFLGDNTSNSTTTSSSPFASGIADATNNSSLFLNKLLRSVVEKGLSRLKWYRSDDVIILTDTTWTPSRKLGLFLKLHDGYPEVFNLRNGQIKAGLEERITFREPFCVGLTLKALTEIVNTEKK